MKAKVRKIPKAPLVAEAENNNGKKTVKEWLEDNKIYFETVLSVTLTIAGIIISVFALIHGYNVAEDEAMLNMPLFNVTQNYVDGSVTIDGITYSADQAVEYKIYNQGGELSNGQASGLRILTVSMWDKDYENVARASFVVSGTFISAGGRYDPSERSFAIYRDERNYEAGRMVDQIENLLIQNYPYRFEVFWVDYAEVSYSDYRGDQHTVLIDLYDGTDVSYSNIEHDGYLYDFYSGDAASTYEMIRASIDSALNSHGE